MEVLGENEVLIKENEALLELFNQNGGLIYQLRYCPDSDNYSFPFCSNELWNVYELTHEQIKNDASAVFNRIHSRDVKRVYQVIQESIKTLSNWSCDFRVLLPEKGVRWLRANGSIKKEENGCYFWNGYIYDITD